MRSFISTAGWTTLVALLAAGCGGGTEPRLGPPASIQAVSNSAPASIIAGSTAPVTLVAKVSDASGNAVSGATVSWSTSSGAVSPPSSATDASGQASTQWSLSSVAGTQTAAATVSGVTGSASFSATVTAAALAKIKMSPDTLKLSVAGDTARATATGADAFDNPVALSSVAFTTDDPAIATVNSAGLVTAQAPGNTVIRATSGTAAGSTVAAVKRPPCFGNAGLSVQVGQVTTLTGTAAAELCVQGATGAEFVAIPFFSPTTGGTLSLTFDPVSTTPALGPPSPSVSASSGFRTAILADGRQLTRDEAWETSFRERSKREMTPLIPAARAAMQQSPSALRRSVSFAVSIAVGDFVNFNVNSSDGCTNPTIRTARVMAVSNKAIVVNDTLNPPGFSDADFQFFAATFDTLVYPVDTSNFGAPTDIDTNGRVILLFTSAVNALTPAGSTSGFIGGFFYNRDLFPQTAPTGSRADACKTSNFAEMFYLLTPDTAGTINGNKHSVSQVRTLTIGTVAHEFQHLINASRHLYINTNTTGFESVFLDEGLAHEAEELTFYRASGLSPGRNLGVADLQATNQTVAAENNFAIQNEHRFREYLKATEANSPYAPNDNLSTRGATWSFLRYAADRSGTDQSSIWFNLVNPNVANMSGLNNLARVLGSNITDQFRDWTAANYLDDAGVPGVPTLDTHPSWNTRSIESFVNNPNNPGFPLSTRQMPAGAKLSFSLIDGGAAYVRFGVPASSVGGAGITSAAGTLPATLSVSVVRTK